MHRDLRALVLVSVIVLVTTVIGCGASESVSGPSGPITSPSESTPGPTVSREAAVEQMPEIDASTAKPSANYTIGFSSLRENRVPITVHLESGFRIFVVSGDWIALTTYGNPLPFIQFYGPAGVTATGELRVTTDGAPFWLNSIDFYSSTTKIPYVIEGSLNSKQVFAVSDVIGNTFGAFARRSNPKADVPVQEIRIRLTNPSAPCCGNPMGVDNIVVSR
jgi:hypothetical protein